MSVLSTAASKVTVAAKLVMAKSAAAKKVKNFFIMIVVLLIKVKIDCIAYPKRVQRYCFYVV